MLPRPSRHLPRGTLMLPRPSNAHRRERMSARSMLLRGLAKLGHEASVEGAKLFPELLRAGVAKGSTGLFAAFGLRKRVLLKHPLHTQCRQTTTALGCALLCRRNNVLAPLTSFSSFQIRPAGQGAKRHRQILGVMGYVFDTRFCLSIETKLGLVHPRIGRHPVFGKRINAI